MKATLAASWTSAGNRLNRSLNWAVRLFFRVIGEKRLRQPSNVVVNRLVTKRRQFIAIKELGVVHKHQFGFLDVRLQDCGALKITILAASLSALP